MSELIQKFNTTIQNLEDLNVDKFADFIAALKGIKAIAEEDLKKNRFYTLGRSQINWAPSLVENLQELLGDVNSQESLEKKLSAVIAHCGDYEKRTELSYPVLTAVGILACSALGALIGLPLGVVVGAASLFIYFSLGIEASALGIHLEGVVATCVLAGTVLGAIGGTVLGAVLGYQKGCALAGDITYEDITTTLFFSEEHKALSQAANSISLAVQAISSA